MGMNKQLHRIGASYGVIKYNRAVGTNRIGRITEREMKKIFAFLALLVSAPIVLAENPLPRDVQKFVDRREGCDHMRGEIPDPSEKQRMKEVNREIEKLCKGTDRQLVQLKTKYASNRLVMQRLNEYEEGIEAPIAPESGNREAGKP